MRITKKHRYLIILLFIGYILLALQVRSLMAKVTVLETIINGQPTEQSYTIDPVPGTPEISI